MRLHRAAVLALMVVGVLTGSVSRICSEQSFPASVPESWRQSVASGLEREEYRASSTPTGLQAPNRAQNVRTYFRSGEIEVVPRDPSTTPSWQFLWRTSGWGRTSSMQAVVQMRSPAVDGDRVVYEHEAFDEWYVNGPQGLEQGFDVHHHPDGNGWLGIRGQIQATFRAEQRDDGTVDFIDANGACVLRYGSLSVRDAGGRTLPARLTTNGETVTILVNDHDAQYPLVIDPLMSSPSWTAEGNQAGARFGVSCGSAGDVNGDGYSDVIVGADQYDNGQTDEGRVFVYYGSASGLATTFAWSAEADQASAKYGASAGTGGDVNGDGYADVIVGAALFNNGQLDEGRAYVYYGSASGLSSTPSWTTEMNQDFSYFGFAVGTAGDVNGDGYADVIVGASLYDNGQTDEGKAFVYLGSAAGLASTPAWSAESDQAFAHFGVSVGTAGDVNGDGYADVIVGADMYDNGQTNEGRAYVYLGSASGLSLTAAWTAESDQASANLGGQVAMAGDVNGDGYSDVIVGAWLYDNGQTDEGRVFVYHGSASGLSLTPNWTMESNQAGALFGSPVGTAGDVNGDGYADVVIGSQAYDDGATDTGKVFVYNGSPVGLLPNFDSVTSIGQVSASFGFWSATAGDVNGDGYSDVVVGAYQYDNGAADEGGAFVYLGGATGITSAYEVKIWTDQNTSGFGVAASSAGDVNGDGFSDVIVGAPSYYNGLFGGGRAYLYYGSPTGVPYVAGWTADGDKNGAHFGTDVATAGDVNGDGYSDVIVGAPDYRNTKTNQGRAYLYLGSASGLSTTPAWFGEGDKADANYGYAVGTAGDVNGDGYSDVIVGAYNYTNSQLYQGRAYLYYGSPTGLTTTPAWMVEGDQIRTGLGVDVGTAGDVNGDGYSDVIVGAFTWKSGVASGLGHAYVYNGSPAGVSTTPSWMAVGNQDASYFGQYSATAGDVNGDGYSDVVVAAPHYDNGEPDEGKAWLYHGSSAGLSLTPAWTAEGNFSYALFGTGIGTAGDMNSDGFSDILVGVPGYGNEAVYAGRACTYLGSATGLKVTPDRILDGHYEAEHLGICVGAAGDVDGDGDSDALVSASGGQPSSSENIAVYPGNGWAGRAFRLQQARSDNTAPIGLLGLSDSENSFLLKAGGVSPAGAAVVNLEYEVKPAGTPFDGTGLVRGSQVKIGSAFGVNSAVQLASLVTGLNPGSLYHWRARVQTDSPFFPYSRWLSVPENNSTEADLRTALPVTAVREPVVGSGLQFKVIGSNPVAHVCSFAYVLPFGGHTRLAIYDINGSQVATVIDGEQGVGEQRMRWDGRGTNGVAASRGMYFARLEFEGRSVTQKIVLAH